MSVQEKMVIKFIIDLVLDKVFNTFLNLNGAFMNTVENGVSGNDSSYLTQLNQLSEIRESFEKNTLNGSNKELYQILSKIYQIFSDMKTNKSKFDIEFLKSALKEMKIKSQNNSPLLTILIRYVFNSDRTRSYNYNRVISSAIQANVSPENLPKFIEEQGGIEECKKKFVKSSTTLENEEMKILQIQNVLDHIDNFESLSNINLGNSKLEIKNDCKLIITIGRLSSDQKSVELFKVLDPTNKPLENKILNIISRDLNKQIEQSKVQTQKTLESVSS
jgi:hypothetical protein